MKLAWAWACCVTATLLSSTVFALDVVAEGEAAIANGDATLARQIALRRAMAAAVEQGGGLLQSTSVTTPNGVQEKTTYSAQSRVLGARILSEHAERGRLRVTAEVRLEDPARPEQCGGRPLRKALVLPFPLRYPEQLRSGEYMDWPQTTAGELARRLNSRGKLLSSALLNRFPFESPEAAPTPARIKGQSAMARWAGEARAQYVVAGLFKDFGIAHQALVIPERQIAIEAYIYDGTSGELLARREFSRQLPFSWQMPKNVVPGTRAFSESRLGTAYYESIDSIGRWAESVITCLPFSARVIQAAGQRLYLDVGSDGGIEPGMELLLARPAPDRTLGAAGDVLDAGLAPLAGIIVKSVHARHSVAEISAGKSAPAAQVGDVAFGL